MLTSIITWCNFNDLFINFFAFIRCLLKLTAWTSKEGMIFLKIFFFGCEILMLRKPKLCKFNAKFIYFAILKFFNVPQETIYAWWIDTNLHIYITAFWFKFLKRLPMDLFPFKNMMQNYLLSEILVIIFFFRNLIWMSQTSIFQKQNFNNKNWMTAHYLKWPSVILA